MAQSERGERGVNLGGTSRRWHVYSRQVKLLNVWSQTRTGGVGASRVWRALEAKLRRNEKRNLEALQKGNQKEGRPLPDGGSRDERMGKSHIQKSLLVLTHWMMRTSPETLCVGQSVYCHRWQQARLRKFGLPVKDGFIWKQRRSGVLKNTGIKEKAPVFLDATEINRKRSSGFDNLIPDHQEERETPGTRTPSAWDRIWNLMEWITHRNIILRKRNRMRGIGPLDKEESRCLQNMTSGFWMNWVMDVQEAEHSWVESSALWTDKAGVS